MDTETCVVVLCNLDTYERSLGRTLFGVFRNMEIARKAVQKRIDQHYKSGHWKEFFNGNWTEEDVKRSLMRDYDFLTEKITEE